MVLLKKRGSSGEEGVREEDISDGQVTFVGVEIVFRVRDRVGGPVEKEKGMVRVGLVLDDFDDQLWAKVRRKLIQRD